jgi:hypothetical protein
MLCLTILTVCTLAGTLTDMLVQLVHISFRFLTVYICMSRQRSFIVVKVVGRCQ